MDYDNWTFLLSLSTWCETALCYYYTPGKCCFNLTAFNVFLFHEQENTFINRSVQVLNNKTAVHLIKDYIFVVKCFLN